MHPASHILKPLLPGWWHEIAFGARDVGCPRADRRRSGSRRYERAPELLEEPVTFLKTKLVRLKSAQESA